jgi:uncharacterized protein (TIRG00374 family)
MSLNSRAALGRWLKRLLSLILLGVLLYFFWPLLGEIRAAADLFRRARWLWLTAAVGIQLVSYAFLTWLNALSLRPFAGQIGFFKLAGLLTAMAFIEMAAPSAGASGVAMRVWLLGKHGYTPEAAMFSLAVETLSEIIALVTVALLGVVYLLRSGHLSPGGVIGMFAAGAALILLVWLAWRLILHPTIFPRLAQALARLWNRLAGRIRRFDLERVAARVATFQVNVTHYRRVPFWKFCLAAYGKVLTDVACLWACYAFLGYAAAPGALLTGYGLILLASGLNALPGGLGMSEVSAPVLLTNLLKVPGPYALAAGLSYRLIAFWAVRFAGFVSWQWLKAGGAPRPGDPSMASVNHSYDQR